MGAKEQKNSLRSRSVASVIDVLGEGEIEVIGGAAGVYLERTQLETNSGKRNFSGCRAYFRPGTKDQSYIPNIRSAENEQNVGLQLKNGIPHIRAITDTSLDAVSVKVRVSALTTTNNKNGNINGAKTIVKISRQNNGGGYTLISTVTFKGKTTSAYERAVRVNLPAGTGPWNIKVERDYPDSNSSFVRNDTFLTSFTLINDEKLTYPYSALVALQVDAQKFGSTFPERRYRAKRINAPYPSNWNPTTRVYTGIWDGLFLTGTHDNPAWYLWELIENNRFGLGDIISSVGIDKWTLYTIAQYCDGMVPDGKGGLEPRFTFNGSVNTRRAGIKLLDAIASVFRGMIFWSAGGVAFAQDAPGTAAVQVTPANTLDGNFSRTSSANKARHTNVLVGWNNPAKLGDIDYVPVDRDDLIQRFGRRPKEVSSFGCTSEGQARRMGEWILDSEENETEVIVWKASFDQIKAFPGTLVAIYDPAHQGARFGGRIMALNRNYETAPKDLTNVAWTKGNATIVANVATDQDGNLLADKVNETAVVGNHFVAGVTKVITLGDYVWAFRILKAAERTKVLLQLSDATNAINARFNLSTGLIEVNPVATAFWANVGASVLSVGNGYYLCAIGGQKITGTASSLLRMYLLDAASAASYLGVAGSGVYHAHGQLELATSAGPPVDGQGVTLDAPVVPDVGETYNLNVMLPDGTIEAKQIVLWSNGNSVVSLASPLSQTPVEAAIWTIDGTSISPELARVTGLFEKSPNVFEVQALKHDPTKYDRVERDRVIPTPPTTVIPVGQLAAPQTLDIEEYFVDINGANEPALLISWQMPADPRVTALQYQWTEDDGDFGDIVEINTTSIDLTSIPEGWFTFQIRSVAQFAVSSDWLIKRVYVVGANKKPSDVSNVRCNVTGGNAVIRWDFNEDAITRNYEIRFSPDTAATWDGGTVVAANISKNTNELSTVARVGKFMVKAVTKNGVYSSVAGSVLNTIGEAPSTLGGVVDESANWYNVNPTAGGFDILSKTSALTDAAFIKTNLTTPSATQIRETAINAEHKFSQQLSIHESDHVTFDWVMVPVGGRNIRIRLSDALGNFVQVDKNTTTHTTIAQTSSGFTGITVSHSTTRTQIDFDTFDESQFILLEMWLLSGTTVSYLGVITSGMDFGSHSLRIQNETMIENGSGFLELATATPGPYRADGYYEFSNASNSSYFDPSLSLAKKTNVRFKAEIEYTVPAGNVVLNDWLTLNDVEFLNGNQSGITITPQVRKADGSSTNPDYGDWMDLTDALYTGRQFQFRFLITSTNPELTPVISSAVINWEIPGYAEGAEGVVSGAAAYNVVFAQEFYAVPSVQVLPYNAPADTLITNKTTTGFRVRFNDSGGSAISRTFDWTATGHGPVIP